MLKLLYTCIYIYKYLLVYILVWILIDQENKMFEEYFEFLIYLYQNFLALRLFIVILAIFLIVLIYQKYRLREKRLNYPNGKVILHQFPRSNSYYFKSILAN